MCLPEPQARELNDEVRSHSLERALNGERYEMWYVTVRLSLFAF
jgi:hypothetical protein